MSVKGKDLSYEAQEPAFLRRIKAQQAGFGDPDRHERPIARPKRMKTGNEDEDDGPTIVDEENDRILTKGEYEAMLAGGDVTGTAKQNEVDGHPGGEVEQVGKKCDSATKSKQEVSEVGQLNKKRKAIKLVGEIDEKHQDDEKARLPSKKPKKKVKAVALSFGGDEG